AEGSTLLDGSDPAAPPQAAINVRPGPGIVAGQAIRLYLVASSLTGLDRLEVTVSGAVADSQVFDLDGERSTNQSIYFSSVPAETVGQTVTVGLRAFDTAGRSTLAQRAYTVDPDIHAPVISLASPGAGTQVTSGDRVRIVGSAS